MDNPADRYDVDAAIVRARKGKTRTAVKIGIMASIIGYYVAWVITDSTSQEITLSAIFLAGMAGFYFLVLIRNARKRIQLAGVVIKEDADGIFAWDYVKQREIKRLSFSNMAKVYWPPSQKVTFITIVGMKDGKEKLHYYSKIHMDGQSFIKQLLSEKAELYERAMTKEEQAGYQ